MKQKDNSIKKNNVIKKIIFKRLAVNLVFCFFLILFLSFLFSFALSYVLIRCRLIPKEGLFPLPILVIFLISLFLGTIFASILMHFFLKPMSEMYQQTKEISQGNFDLTPIELKSEDKDSELSQFIQSFNTMVSELKKNEMLKNDFIANVSHEFKTPLATIQGYATLLQDPTLSDADRISHTACIIDATRELSSLTTNILRICKIDNQEFVLKKERFSLDEQIRRAILLQETRWSEKELELDIVLDSVMLSSDEELLSQVWLNLISNAIKFNRQKGKLGVYLTKEHHVAKVVVKDTGIGMSADTMNHIFDKFYQGDTSHGREGNGLGLTLVKKILLVVGGCIQVQSVEGVGSTFEVTLPLESNKDCEK
jgi:signal transduction histidine kinase